MPIALIKKKIKENLKRIDYEPICIDNKRLVSLKQSIISDSSISIEIISKDLFNIILPMKVYSEIISLNFYLNYQRFLIQKQQLDLLKKSDSIAWFLVSTYYASFFAVNEISNLIGLFNFNFENEDKKKLFIRNISTNSVSSEFLNSDTNNFFAKLTFNDTENKVILKCENGGGKPHKLAWDNFLKVITTLDIGSDSDRVCRINKLKNILNEKNKWKRPSKIRNNWNYSIPNLYFEHNDQFKKDQSKYFNNFDKLKDWAENRKIYSQGENDEFISILYLYEISSSIIESIKNDIIIL